MVVPSHAAGREDRRIDKSEVVRIEVVSDRFDDFVPNLNGRVLAAAPKPEVPVIHQEVDAMLFGRDRIWMIFRDALDDFRSVHIKLIAAGSPRLRSYSSCHHQRAFLGKALQRVKCLLGQVALDRYALHEPAAVAYQRKDDFAGFAQII